MQSLWLAAWLKSAQGKEAPRLLLNKVRKVLTCSQRQVFSAEMLLSKPFLGQPDNVIRLCLMVLNRRVQVLKRHIDSAVHRHGCSVTNFLNSLLYLAESRFAVATDSSLHKCCVREDIKRVARFKVTNRKNERFTVVDIARFDRVKSLVNCVCAGNWVY
jgi:hypothetical protein